MASMASIRPPGSRTQRSSGCSQGHRTRGSTAPWRPARSRPRAARTSPRTSLRPPRFRHSGGPRHGKTVLRVASPFFPRIRVFLENHRPKTQGKTAGFLKRTRVEKNGGNPAVGRRCIPKTYVSSIPSTCRSPSTRTIRPLQDPQRPQMRSWDATKAASHDGFRTLVGFEGNQKETVAIKKGDPFFLASPSCFALVHH